MLACKGIFAKPSMLQPRKARSGMSRKGLRQQDFLHILYHSFGALCNIRRNFP